MTRTEAVEQAVRFAAPLDALTASLDQFPWDRRSARVTIRRADVVAVLDRFIRGELTGEDVCGWAALLEAREDVEVEDSTDQLVATVFFWLANPAINLPAERLERDFAASLRERIESA